MCSFFAEAKEKPVTDLGVDVDRLPPRSLVRAGRIPCWRTDRGLAFRFVLSRFAVALESQERTENEAHMLKRCLWSLARESWADWEGVALGV